MSLHIGGKMEIAERKILMILDFDQAVSNPDTDSFLKKSRSKSETDKKTETTKSIVVTEKNGKIDLFYSPISSVTLAGRCKNEWSE